jgi:hydroxysqualene dehydroxylase
VNVHVVYDRPVLPVPLAAAVRSPVQWVFDRTLASGLPAGQYLAVSLSAADSWVDRPTGEMRSVFLPALAELLPRARSANVEELFVTRERRATFRQGVGSAALRPGPATALPGLLLAGAWTDTGWPDTMESAVRSGRTAVAGALDHLTRTSPARRSTADKRGGSAA